ncbi:MAG: hypothetical protein AAF762_09870 [Pseudomonadota bacterium]
MSARGAIIALLVAATPLHALTPAECNRVTHISHAGESGHRDLGAGRVGYAEWWSQEGTYLDLVIADCNDGVFLRTRTQEERISDRPAFDRTDDALKIIEQELTASPSLFSFTRLADALKRTGRDIKVDQAGTESCACAAYYPDLRGDRAPFPGVE